MANTVSSTNTSSDNALNDLLSFPMDFSIDPLMTFQNTSSCSPSPLSHNEALFPLTSELMSSSPPSDGSTISSSDSCSTIGSPNMMTMPTIIKKKGMKPGTTKKARLTLEDKDQKTKERILRNRAAAQESRDRKRKYVADLETSNKRLTTENESMNKRMKLLELENQSLQQQLALFAQQLAQIQASQQQQQKVNNTSSSSLVSSSSSLFTHGFCDSARIVIKGLSYLL
ncbi:unnamed protein product [Cunninghamella echinulata]